MERVPDTHRREMRKHLPARELLHQHPGLEASCHVLGLGWQVCVGECGQAGQQSMGWSSYKWEPQRNSSSSTSAARGPSGPQTMAHGLIAGDQPVSWFSQNSSGNDVHVVGHIREFRLANP